MTIFLFACNENKEVIINLENKSSNPALFAKGLISTALYERDIAINKDGSEIIYTIGDYKQKRRCLVTIKKINGNWNEPAILNISGEHQDIEPFFSNDDQRLYFASNRPIDETDITPDYNIWYSQRTSDGWAEPTALNNLINTDQDEFYPSLSANGNLYFTASRSDGIGREDIFVSQLVNDEFQKPMVLDSNINTTLFEFNAYINPDENLLIFSSYGRADDLGGGDLYYSIKDINGQWAPSKNMGAKINSDKLDYCPFIDQSRQVFYFTSENSTPEIHRMNTINELTSLANNPQNGFGDIYSVSLDSLFQN
jgi:hypothetical protein